MPFASQAQAGWAFATGQPWAKRWARETGPYKKLSKRVKRKTCMDCVLASLKGEQIAPGITRIRGNLCNVHGRYGPCDGAVGGSKRAVKPKGGKRAARKPRQPAKTTAQRQEERANQQGENRGKVLGRLGIAPDGEAALMALRNGQQPDAAALARGGFVDAGLVEQAADGSYRLTPSGRALMSAANSGDAGRGGDIVSAARDRKAARTTRERAAAQKKLDAAAKRAEAAAAKKPAAGGGGKKQPASSGSPRAVSPEQAARQEQRDREHAEDRAYTLRRRQEITQDRQDRLRRQAERDAERAAERQQRASVIPTPTPARVARTRTPIIMPRRSNRGIRRSKSFAVFKDASGAYRWISRTTTAYEDRDAEVISTKALETSAASDAPRGPLRWWHMGRPDPLDHAQPWGAGVDLGWCDFAALSGRTLIESGTFKSEAIARAVAAHADDLELSPGFFHAAGEPDASGVFSHIRIFERSLVPKWAGRASNLYTGLVVEKTMDQKKIQALKELGASDEVITALLADVQQTEKSAEADGVRYKDARPVVDFFSRLLRGEQITTKEEAEQPAAEAEGAAEPEQPPDPVAVLKEELAALRAEVATLKADGFPPAEEEKQDEAFAEEPVAEEPMMEEEAGGLTLSSEDLSAIGQVIAATLEPLIGALGITQKLEGHLGELKTMMSGYVKTKDDAQAALISRLDQAEAKVADLAGEAPRAQGYRASAAPDNTVEALVAAATMKDGAMPTADNPFADLVANLFAQQR